MVGCVGQVTGKTPVGIRMALLTGLDDLIEADMGIRIVYPQDIMSPVTIRTFSRFQISQSIRLAVHGVQVRFPESLMAFSTLIGNFGQKFILRAHLYFMGGVAILAGRQLFLCPAYSGAVNALDKCVVNPLMACAAGGRNVLDVD